VSLVSFRGGAEAKQALAGDSLDLIFDSPTGVISMIAASQPVIGIYAGCNQTDFSWLAKPSVKSWTICAAPRSGSRRSERVPTR
jgi:hypothetical protein